MGCYDRISNGDFVPDYAIDPQDYPGDECAFCGADEDLVAMHVRNRGRGGAATVPGCRGCNSSMRRSTLKEWLRRLRDQQGVRWFDIEIFHHGRRSTISKLVHAVRDEG